MIWSEVKQLNAVVAYRYHYKSKAQSQALQDQSRRHASMDTLP
jgi:hypothetical protein